MGAGATDATAAVFRLLADEHSRRILLAADQEPRTAKDLSDICDASLTTVYRRISSLQEHDLLRTHSTVGSDGSHRRQFETTLEELHVTVSDGELALSVETHDELADNFTSLWTNIRERR
jgi:DNA-binding transcriptional ArsR family regulator